MINWKDQSSYSKNDKERIPSILKAKVQDITIVVHRHIHYTDTWLLSCHNLKIEKYDLHTNDLEEAKKRGIEKIISKIKSMEEIINTLEEELLSE